VILEVGASTETDSPVIVLLDLLGRRWALRILWELRASPIPTFRELQRSCGDISSSVLAQRLRELTGAGIVVRSASGYSMTPEGRELLDALAPIDCWAEGWARHGSAAARTAAGSDAASGL
jgi:DNA-binding HxlR family transcriptional regulator